MKQFIKDKIREGLLMETRISFDMSLPEDILKIQSVFKSNGFKLFVVGGAVRDALLGKTPKDFDLATNALPDKVEQMMNQAGFRTLATGKAFGVINVFTDTDEFEIATFRTDIGSGRRPDSVEFTNIENDVKRRDLTINALFFDIDTKEIVDLVGGVDDLKNGVVRTVGKPEDRFGEDRLRIMRAIRFAGRFGSDLDPATAAALEKDSSIKGVSGERIFDEFFKGISSSKSVRHFLNLLDRFHLLEQIFKGFRINKEFVENNDSRIQIGTLLRDNDTKSMAKKLTDLKCTVDESGDIKIRVISGIVFLIRLLTLRLETAVQLKRQQGSVEITEDEMRKFGQLNGLDQKLLNAFINFRLTVNGDDLAQKLNLQPGKELGDAIASAELENFKKML